MDGKEIFTAMKALQDDRMKHTNFTTGVYSKETEKYNNRIRELQSLCSHVLEDGETAFFITPDTNEKICSICLKKNI